MNHPAGPRILVINPGSTSTKVALFVGGSPESEASLPAPPPEAVQELWDEFPLRLAGIREWMAEQGIELDHLAAVVGRGGLFRPVEGGTYLVGEALLADARANRQGAHASNLGSALARVLADRATEARAEDAGVNDGLADGESPAGHEGSRGREEGGGFLPGVPAFVVDPVSTDEFCEAARLSGLEEIPRRSLSHALSIHALVRQVCETKGRELETSRFVVAHLGGGISVCPVVGGRILDANNANSGGPFSPTRAGGLPTQELLELAFAGTHSHKELRQLTLKRGGLMSYLGTDDAREVEARIKEGDEKARRIYEAMAYQIAKEIGAMATVLKGDVDGILLTGGVANSSVLTEWIRDRVAFLAPVELWPEVGEMKALALGALRVLQGDEFAKEY